MRRNTARVMTGGAPAEWLGANFWSRTGGPLMWRSYDPEVVRAELAVLKARSPSCGCHQVYDGTFSRVLRAGDGLTAAALRGAGLSVMSEEDLAGGSGEDYAS